MNGRAPGAIILPERLDAASVPALWSQLLARARPGAELTLDLSATRAIDTAGVALILALEERTGREALLEGAAVEIRRLVERGRGIGGQRSPAAPQPSPSLPVVVGSAVVARVGRWRDGLAFLGRIAAAVASTIVQPGTLCPREIIRQAEKIGNRALPLVALIGFLFGLILSFQSALPMRQFGAEIYVASLVSVSVFRELGPLLASVILAARSGSAFAAEIGTMKVNEEIEALTVMGLDPFRFLVVPRLIAAVVMVPVLIVAMNLTALAGMVTVMTSLGFPFAALSTQVVNWSTPADVFGGLA